MDGTHVIHVDGTRVFHIDRTRDFHADFCLKNTRKMKLGHFEKESKNARFSLMTEELQTHFFWSSSSEKRKSDLTFLFLICIFFLFFSLFFSYFFFPFFAPIYSVASGFLLRRRFMFYLFSFLC